MACLLHDHLRSSIVKKNTKSRTFWMHSIMAEVENFNTLCIGRVIHTLTTPGLITRTYMLLMHWQTSCLQILLRLDDLQYKETTEISQMILIPTSPWLFNTLQQLLPFTAPFALTIQTYSSLFTPHTTAQPSQQCLAHPPPSSSLPACLPLPTVLATPLMLSTLLRTVPPTVR